MANGMAFDPFANQQMAPSPHLLSPDYDVHRRVPSSATSVSSLSSLAESDISTAPFHGSPQSISANQHGFPANLPRPLPNRSASLDTNDQLLSPGVQRTTRSRTASATRPYPPYSLRHSISADHVNYHDQNSIGLHAIDYAIPDPSSLFLNSEHHPSGSAPSMSRQDSDRSISKFAGKFNLQIDTAIASPASSTTKNDALAKFAKQIANASTAVQAEKARSAFVKQWIARLRDNYVAAPGGNVPRQALFTSYSQACDSYQIRGVNVASFGKAVRAAFPNLKTRRLGVRGNSKYNYSGIRPTNPRELSRITQLASVSTPATTTGSVSGDESPISPDTSTSSPSVFVGSKRTSCLNFPRLESILESHPRLCTELFTQLWLAFDKLSLDFVDAISMERYDQVEALVSNFYSSHVTSGEVLLLFDDAAVCEQFSLGEAAIYGNSIDILRSRIQKPLPPTTFFAIQRLANTFEDSVAAVSERLPPCSIGPKIELAARFCHLLLRYTGLCQLLQALQGVIVNPQAVKAMYESWSKIDFAAIGNHCALSVNCQPEPLNICLDSFQTILSSPETFDIAHIIKWTDQLKGLLDTIPDLQRSSGGRLLLMQLNFVTGQLMRDLTLRSDANFGSFQIVALFIQDLLSFDLLQTKTLRTQAVTASIELAAQSATLTREGFSLQPTEEQTYSSSFTNFDQPPHQFQASGLPAHEIYPASISPDGIEHQPFNAPPWTSSVQSSPTQSFDYAASPAIEPSTNAIHDPWHMTLPQSATRTSFDFILDPAQAESNI